MGTEQDHNAKLLPSQKVDEAVTQFDLFLPLMRILENSKEPKLLELTWKLIGFLCSCQFTANNVINFVENKWLNLIPLIKNTLCEQ